MQSTRNHPTPIISTFKDPAPKEVRVLVINSCQKMAKEITVELMQSIVGASITYAPTFTLAKMLLARRTFELVVSSSRMPDGRVQMLEKSLNSAPTAPTLVVIGNAASRKTDMLGVEGYLFSAIQKLANRSDLPSARAPLELVEKTSVPVGSGPAAPDSIKNLGADLRNDLNNPLQEIVAMVYVAKSERASADVTKEALEAINRAATNLSVVVRGIEDKIRLVVQS